MSFFFKYIYVNFQAYQSYYFKRNKISKFIEKRNYKLVTEYCKLHFLHPKQIQSSNCTEKVINYFLDKNNFQIRIAITLAEYLVNHPKKFDRVSFFVMTTMRVFIKFVKSKGKQTLCLKILVHQKALQKDWMLRIPLNLSMLNLFHKCSHIDIWNFSNVLFIGQDGYYFELFSLI